MISYILHLFWLLILVPSEGNCHQVVYIFNHKLPPFFVRIIGLDVKTAKFKTKWMVSSQSKLEDHLVNYWFSTAHIIITASSQQVLGIIGSVCFALFVSYELWDTCIYHAVLCQTNLNFLLLCQFTYHGKNFLECFWEKWIIVTIFLLLNSKWREID